MAEHRRASFAAVSILSAPSSLGLYTPLRFHQLHKWMIVGWVLLKRVEYFLAFYIPLSIMEGLMGIGGEILGFGFVNHT